MEVTNKEILDQLQKHDAHDMERFGRIDTQLNTINEAVKDIKDILKGEPDFRRKGLVEMVDTHETYFKRLIWTAGLLMAIGSLLGFVISKL